MHSVNKNQQNIYKIAEEGSNWDPRGHDATALPFACDSIYVEKLTQVYFCFPCDTEVARISCLPRNCARCENRVPDTQTDRQTDRQTDQV